MIETRDDEGGSEAGVLLVVTEAEEAETDSVDVVVAVAGREAAAMRDVEG
jgi:hypothetical protein